MDSEIEEELVFKILKDCIKSLALKSIDKKIKEVAKLGDEKALGELIIIRKKHYKKTVMSDEKNLFNEFIEKDTEISRVDDSLKLYFKCIKSFPILTEEEEKNLAKTINEKKIDLIKELLHIPFVQRKIYELSNIFFQRS